jgi:hypothetical protein
MGMFFCSEPLPWGIGVLEKEEEHSQPIRNRAKQELPRRNEIICLTS